MQKNRLNKGVKDTIYRNKPLAVNRRRFINYGAFLKHLNKCMDQALKGTINEPV